MPGQLNQQRVTNVGRLSNLSSASAASQFMADVVMKKSKLEQDKEMSKKRHFSEISKEIDEPIVDNFQPKRKKLNEVEKKSSGFLSDVVIRKSRLELEIEAARKA